MFDLNYIRKEISDNRFQIVRKDDSGKITSHDKGNPIVLGEGAFGEVFLFRYTGKDKIVKKFLGSPGGYFALKIAKDLPHKTAHEVEAELQDEAKILEVLEMGVLFDATYNGKPIHGLLSLYFGFEYDDGYPPVKSMDVADYFDKLRSHEQDDPSRGLAEAKNALLIKTPKLDSDLAKAQIVLAETQAAYDKASASGLDGEALWPFEDARSSADDTVTSLKEELLSLKSSVGFYQQAIAETPRFIQSDLPAFKRDKANFAANIFSQLIREQDLMHRKVPPVVHGDFCPWNTLMKGGLGIDNNQEPTRIKIIDFGMSHQLSSKKSQSDNPNPAFKHIRAISGSPPVIDLRNDIYARKATLIELLGRPFDTFSLTIKTDRKLPMDANDDSTSLAYYLESLAKRLEGCEVPKSYKFLLSALSDYLMTMPADCALLDDTKAFDAAIDQYVQNRIAYHQLSNGGKGNDLQDELLQILGGDKTRFLSAQAEAQRQIKEGLTSSKLESERMLSPQALKHLAHQTYEDKVSARSTDCHLI